jgi:ABC-type uncharacterized transport system ATPase subunit
MALPRLLMVDEPFLGLAPRVVEQMKSVFQALQAEGIAILFHRTQPISRTQELEHLAQADWHIAEVKSHITRQRLRVKHALDTGQCSEVLDSMLRALEASLRAFERHRELVLNQLTRRLSQ